MEYPNNPTNPHDPNGFNHPYQQQPQQQPAYVEGCLTTAWHDITATPGWVGKMCILGLLECVPILNFVVSGYALNWSREVPFGVKAPMPSSYVTGKNFELGFYAFLIALVFSLCGSIVSGIVGWVPLLGWIAALAVTVFASMLVLVLNVRMAMMQMLGEGFSINKAWMAMKRNWTQLLVIVLVPGLVMALVLSVIMVIALLIAGVGSMGAFTASMAGATVAPAAIASLLGSLGSSFAVVALVSAFCSGVIEVLTIRATAHWVARYAPEWVGDSWRAAGYR